ncbi:hypothetical protein [Salipiger abyssi]|uniref:hypothetical protein n=1 Tax=Salipiger abyssi TaxID=1250539 RepID=UPI001A8CAB0D|nr:hypothetical protein [Salipiger abyssi]MBN9890147.1 hypothetical protein [Salipiger abyssi]
MSFPQVYKFIGQNRNFVAWLGTYSQKSARNLHRSPPGCGPHPFARADLVFKPATKFCAASSAALESLSHVRRFQQISTTARATKSLSFFPHLTEARFAKTYVKVPSKA